MDAWMIRRNYHEREGAKDALEIVDSDAKRLANGWVGVRDVGLNGPFEFRIRDASSLAAEVDFPSNNAGWPIFSRRALEAIAGVGEIRCRLFDVLVGGAGGYVVPQMLERVSLVDWGRSDWELHDKEVFLGAVGGVMRRLSFVSVELPPLFRLAGMSALFVSAKARHALEGNIEGVGFGSTEEMGELVRVPVAIANARA